MNVVHESGADRAYTEPKGGGRDEPPRTDQFASHIGRDLEYDIGDVEDGEHPVVVIAFQVEVLFETGQLRVTCKSDVVRLNSSSRREGITYRYWHDQ